MELEAAYRSQSRTLERLLRQARSQAVRRVFAQALAALTVAHTAYNQFARRSARHDDAARRWSLDWAKAVNRFSQLDATIAASLAEATKASEEARRARAEAPPAVPEQILGMLDESVEFWSQYQESMRARLAIHRRIRTGLSQAGPDAARALEDLWMTHTRQFREGVLGLLEHRDESRAIRAGTAMVRFLVAVSPTGPFVAGLEAIERVLEDPHRSLREADREVNEIERFGASLKTTAWLIDLASILLAGETAPDATEVRAGIGRLIEAKTEEILEPGTENPD